MKSIGLVLALALAAGPLAMAAPENAAPAPVAAASADASTAIASPAPEPAPVPCQWVDNEGTHVQETINNFNSALASHDVDKLHAVGIESVSAKGWQRFFHDNPRATITDSCPSSDLVINGDTASWDCIERSTIINDGKPVPYMRLIHFTFTKTSLGWLIADRK
jgi:hypothetical protein